MAALLGLAGCSSASSGRSATSRHPLGDSAIKSAAVVVRAAPFQRPLDAAPSPDGVLHRTSRDRIHQVSDLI
jgi:hypothetical protein